MGTRMRAFSATISDSHDVKKKGNRHILMLPYPFPILSTETRVFSLPINST